jgi:hypothetical protein
MLPWFRPKCPVPPEEKDWIERRMCWLGAEFGWQRLREAPVVLPTPEFFPDPYAGTEEDVRTLFDRICGYMGIPPDGIELGFYSEEEPELGEQFRLQGRRSGTAGLYRGGGRTRIDLEVSRLNDPISVVATLAHELGHVHLLGHGRISRDAEDHEPLTDLLTVFLGMGVFTANAYLRESRWQGVQYSGWSLSRQGYLLAPAYGYAFALFAWIRGELKPSWAGHLRLDVRAPFAQGLRYLVKTGDTAFKPMRDG